MDADTQLLARLEADGILQRSGDGHRTTRRWQAAMMRAALARMAVGMDDEDPRVAIVTALLDLYGDDLDEDELTRLTELMLPIEARELGFAPPPVTLAGER